MFTKSRQIFRFKYIILNILLHILRVIIFECNNIKYPLTLKSKSYFNVSCALHLISTFVLLPLGWYLCCWIISHRRYHPLSSQFWRALFDMLPKLFICLTFQYFDFLKTHFGIKMSICHVKESWYLLVWNKYTTSGKPPLTPFKNG